MSSTNIFKCIYHLAESVKRLIVWETNKIKCNVEK